MELNEVDLHIHTKNSDGEYQVDEILTKAKNANIKFIGIVDHDTTKQFEALKNSELAKQMLAEGYRIFAGIEFSSKIDDKKLHLIGYGVDYHNEEILKLIKELELMREKKFEMRIEGLKKLNVFFTDDQIAEMKKIKNVGKPHMAKYMIENGYATSVDDAIKNYIDKVGEFNKVDAKKVIDAVHNAKGMIIIAHPYQIAEENKISVDEAEKIWLKLKDLGADGMECYYSKYDANQIQKLIEFANKNNLQITMGSDFHGEHIKPDIKIGQIIKK